MKLWPILLILSCLVAGCGPREGRHAGAPPVGKTPSGAAPSSIEEGLYGRWIGKKPEEPKAAGKKPTDPKTKPSTSTSGGDMSPSLTDMMGGFSIDLKDDYSFRMDLAGTNLDGTWEMKGDEVHLTVEHVMGKAKADYANPESDIDKEFAKFFVTPPSPKVRDSGKKLVVPHESAKGLVFTKEVK
jgi:hypothetical protein